MLLLKIGFQVWRRQPLLQALFASALAALALGGASLFALDRNLKPLVKGHLSERTVSLYLEAGSDSALSQAVIDSVRTTVGASPRIRLMDRTETVAQLEKDHPSLAKELGALAPREVQALVPESVLVEGTVSTRDVEALRGIEGVERVEWVAGKYRQAASAVQAFRWILRSMMAAFALAAGIMCVQIARTQHALLASAQRVIRAAGAKAWQMAIPGAVAGGLSGVIAGGVAALGWLFALRPAFQSVRGLSPALENIGDPSALGAAVVMVACLVSAGLAGAVTPLFTRERARA